MMYVPLKITTDYSLLQSRIKMEELIVFLKENKFTAAAIVDENLYGAMEFYNECQKNNIKPIIGLELLWEDKAFYCYAKNYQGYRNLLKIHTKKEKKELKIDDLLKYKTDIKVIVPYESIDIFPKIKNIFEETYLGYQTYFEKNNALITTEKIVYVWNTKALKEEELNDLDYLEMIWKGTTKENYQPKDHSKNYLTLEVEEEDAEETIAFIQDIQIDIPKTNRYIPHFDAKISNSFEFLVALSKKGLEKRQNQNVTIEYKKRLKYELETIQKMGFVDYFLIVYDYVRYAKKNNILVGPGRGSAAGSLVSYALGITDVDPLRYQLLFERFLNPERITMPDIDIDFEYTKRGKVIQYVKEKYGRDAVAGIMTFGTLGSKQVLRDVGKCLELDPKLIDHFVLKIDAKKTLRENLEDSLVKEQVKKNKIIENWYTISMHLEGLKRHISTHAAGVVISSVPLDEVIPICYNAGEMLTGVTMNYLEELGLLKMDFLALRNLTIIQNTLNLIEKNTQIKIDLNKINLNDKKVIELFYRADTTGIFQFESIGMTHFLKKLKPTHFFDLVAALALFRPGPMENIDSFIRRKEGKEKIEYYHLDLEDILKETYGIMVYQEQIMQVLSKIGGFSFAESDNIRRAMSKKKKEVILAYQNKFINGAISNGYDQNLAHKIYELILKFANYGFNKAHSVSYALIGYQMAYLKVNYPIYYITNLLNMSIGATEKTKEYLILAKKYNYQILHPDINQSLAEYRILENKIMLPFTAIKNLGSESTEAILREREKGPFLDFFDFVARTYQKSVNKKTIECLIDAKAFYHIEPSIATLKENIDSAINYATLVSDLDESFILKPTLKKVEGETKDDRIQELESFGFYISNHPSSRYQDKSITKIDVIQKRFDQYVKCVVVIESIRKIETKKKEPMAFVSGSDETGIFDFVVFQNVFPVLNKLKRNDLVLIEGKVTKRFDKYQVNVINMKGSIT